jgi:hypothetical protein
MLLFATFFAERSFTMTPLRQRMLEDMDIRNFTKNTQSSYLTQVGAFAKHFGKSPKLLGLEEIRAWQVYLLKVKKLIPHSIGIATAELRFLYKITLKREWPVEEIPLPKRPHKLPVDPQSRGGGALLRVHLYMATLTAKRCNRAIKQFFDRLTAAGKPFKVAITACIRKLLTIVNGIMIGQGKN